MDYRCPICRKIIDFQARYPRALCPECVAKATDKNGRPITFYNQDLSGGCLAFYRDNKEPYHQPECYVEGIKCYADEARMGGVVLLMND